MTSRIAIIADGRLFITGTDGKSKNHPCQFAADMDRRQQKTSDKSAWMRGGGDGGMFSSSTVWGKRGGEMAPSPRPQIVGVAGGDRPNSMNYALWTGLVGAFLDYDFSENYERRVFHRENFHVSQLDRNARDGRLICRVGDDGDSSLGLLEPDGRNARLVTEGDSIDGAPSWVPQTENTVIYHSAGLSRDARGVIRGLGPFEIHRLDLSGGDLETLVKSSGHDLLAPQMDPAGNLHYIRRPYEGLDGIRPSIWTTLKDSVLFPFRLVRAIIDFFQIFSQMVSKKPLTTSGGPKMQGPEPMHLWIYGRMIDLRKTNGKGNTEGALAPSDWVLVRRSTAGSEEILAKHVVAFDIAADGRIAWSDGRNLHLIAFGGSKKLMSEPLIEAVKWIEAPGNPDDALTSA